MFRRGGRHVQVSGRQVGKAHGTGARHCFDPGSVPIRHHTGLAACMCRSPVEALQALEPLLKLIQERLRDSPQEICESPAPWIRRCVHPNQERRRACISALQVLLHWIRACLQWICEDSPCSRLSAGGCMVLEIVNWPSPAAKQERKLMGDRRVSDR